LWWFISGLLALDFAPIGTKLVGKNPAPVGTGINAPKNSKMPREKTEKRKNVESQSPSIDDHHPVWINTPTFGHGDSIKLEAPAPSMLPDTLILKNFSSQAFNFQQKGTLCEYQSYHSYHIYIYICIHTYLLYV
jgi:hypothetical protein